MNWIRLSVPFSGIFLPNLSTKFFSLIPRKSRLFIQVVLAKKEWGPGTLNERMVLLAPGDLRHERRSFGWGAQFFACSIRHEGRPPGRRTKPGVPASSLQPFPQIAKEPSPPSD